MHWRGWRVAWVALVLATGCGGESPGEDDGGSSAVDGGPADGDAATMDDDASVTSPNAPPESSIDAPGPEGPFFAYEPVVFAGSCVDADGAPSAHAWDFDGGAPSSSEEDPGAVTFDTPGTYVVTYTCTDDDGAPDPTPATLTLVVEASSHEWVALTGDLHRSFRDSVAFVDALGDGGQTGPFSGGWPDDRVLTATWDARLSPDERHVAFLVRDSPLGSSAARDLFVVDAWRQRPQAVAVATGSVQAFRWSPDGSRLAYVEASARRELRVLDLSRGLAAPELVATAVLGPAGSDFGVQAGFPTEQAEWAWASSSAALYFTGDPFGVGQERVHVLELDGPSPAARPLQASGEGLAVWAAGEHIALFLGRIEGPRVDLYAVDRRDGTPVPIRLNPPTFAGGHGVLAVGFERAVRVSPDGTRALFQAAVEDEYRDLFAIDLSAGVPSAPGAAQRINHGFDRRRLSFGETWSEVGHRVLFRESSGRDLRHYVVELGGASPGAPRAVSGPTELGNFPDHTFTRDGGGVVFAAETAAGVARDLFFTSLAPSAAPPRRISRPTSEAGVRPTRLTWLSPTQVVYLASFDSEESQLFVSDISRPETSTRLGAAIDPADPLVGGGCSSAVRVLDANRIVTLCAWRSFRAEAVLFDLRNPSTTTALHTVPTGFEGVWSIVAAYRPGG